MLSNLVVWGDEEKVKETSDNISVGLEDGDFYSGSEGGGESGSVCATGLCGKDPSSQCTGCVIDIECVRKFFFVSKAISVVILPFCLKGVV